MPHGGSVGQEGRHSIYRKIRVRKEDSAFVYFILESYEGMTSYSTLDFKIGDNYRDLELRIAPDFLGEVESLLIGLGDMVYQGGTDL